MTYEQLIQFAEYDEIEVIEFNFKSGLNGLYCDNTIAINPKIETTTEKKCILAEELGHYYTTVGDILDQNNISNRKQELMARRWGYEKLIPLMDLIEASFRNCTNLYELAEYLNVTEEFLNDTLHHYQNKYGLYAEVGDYCIYFDPLTVCKYNYE